MNPILEAKVSGLSEAIGMLHMVKNVIYDGENDMTKRLCVRLENEICDRIFALKQSEKSYLDGLMRAHEVAMGCLPIPCGNREKLRQVGTIMGIVIKAIEAEIQKVREEKV